MNRFIIAYGWKSDMRVIEAKSIEDARAIATQLSLEDGLLDDDLSDTTWAEPYTDDLAFEYGLLPYEYAE